MKFYITYHYSWLSTSNWGLSKWLLPKMIFISIMNCVHCKHSSLWSNYGISDFNQRIILWEKNLVDYFAKGCGCFSCIFLFALGVKSIMQVVKYHETVGFTIGYTFIHINILKWFNVRNYDKSFTVHVPQVYWSPKISDCFLCVCILNLHKRRCFVPCKRCLKVTKMVMTFSMFSLKCVYTDVISFPLNWLELLYLCLIVSCS